jgi:UDP-2,3-diacylglucosamine hydrolase
MSSILLLGDAHLHEGDPELGFFLRFLKSLPSRTSALYLLGDLFDLWIGAEEFLSASHSRVVEALRELRACGVPLTYVEGNRDYHLGRVFRPDPFQEVAGEGTDVAFGSRRIHLAHGDLVNRADRPYRLWRRIAKGPLLLAALRLLPSGTARALARALERGIARTNQRHRARFPEEECRRFALEQLQRGNDTLVLGHFHEEARREYRGPQGTIEVYVLPAWRDGRRSLRIFEDGRAAFEGFGGGGDPS